MFIAGACSFFWVNGFLNSLLAAYPAHTEKGKYLFNVFLLLVCCSVIVFLSLKVAEPFLTTFLTKEALHYLPLFSYFILLNSPCFLIEYIYLLKEKSKHLLTYGIIVFFLTITFTVVPLYLGLGLIVSLQALVALSIFKLLWLIRLIVKHTELKIESKYLSQHFYLAFPLVLSFLMSGSAEYIDGLMVNHFFGAEMFAIFRYGAKEFPLSLLIANALSTALIPILSESGQLDKGMSLIKEKSRRLMHLLFPLSILLLSLSNWFYPMVFNSHFSASAPIFNTFLLLIICRLLFPQSLIMALKKTKVILIISVIEIAVNVIASYLLMLQFGIIGIAYGTVLAFFVEKIILIFYLYKYQNILPWKYIPINTWSAYCLLLLLCYVFMQVI